MGIGIVQRYCPNCGQLVSGIRGEDKIARMSCSLCGTVFVSKLKSRRHDSLDVYAPKGAEIMEYYTEEAVR